jgi:homocitrate synthase NifV
MRLIDSTLRDGEQTPGLAFSSEQKLRLAMWMDQAGIYQIEAGVPAMGKEEKRVIERIKAHCKRSRISTWNRLRVDDIDHAMDCAPDSIHIGAPVSDLHIRQKLRKDRRWLLDQLKRCVSRARAKGYAVSVGFEDASRADMDFLISVCHMLEGLQVEFVRFADTVGILTPGLTYRAIRRLLDGLEGSSMGVGIHAHNDLGMALANSLAAAEAGAAYADVTLFGIGERAGNCDLAPFVSAGSRRWDMGITPEQALELERLAADIIQPGSPGPVAGHTPVASGR